MMAALVAWLRRVTADLRHILRDAWHGSCTEQRWLEPPEDLGALMTWDNPLAEHRDDFADDTDDCGCPEDCPEDSGHEWWCTR